MGTRRSKGTNAADAARHAELLSAVLADPAADEPRLVFADWLSERGDPRGEFIALQCEAFRIPYGTQVERAAAIHEKERELHRRYAARWTPFLRGLKPRPKYLFSRGFLGWIALKDQPALEAAVAAALASEPITSMKIDYIRDLGAIARVLAGPGFGRVSTLELVAYNVEARLLEVVAAAPLSRVRVLALEHFAEDERARLLARSPNLGAVEVLSLAYGAITDEGVRALCAAVSLPRLVELNLSHNAITDAGAAALGEARGLPSLARLNLRANPGISNGALEALKQRLRLS